jgi:hypothetical protein
MTDANNPFCQRRAYKMRTPELSLSEKGYRLWVFHDHIFPEDIPDGMTAAEERKERIYQYEQELADWYDQSGAMLDDIIFEDGRDVRPWC